MRVVIVGGVAGGMSVAARLRRLDAEAEIVVLERSRHVSYANCGLPYYIGGVIKEEASLLLQTPESLHDRFRIDVRVCNEALAIDRQAKKVKVRDRATGDEYAISYDKLVLSPGAGPRHSPHTRDRASAHIALHGRCSSHRRRARSSAGVRRCHRRWFHRG